MYLKIIIMGIFCIVLIFCERPSHISIQIQGYVINASDGSPIEGARVSIWHRAWLDGDYDYESGHSHTDNNGYFYIRFTVHNCNRFRCDAYADGFEVPVLGFPEIDAKVRCTEDSQTITFRLVPE